MEIEKYFDSKYFVNEYIPYLQFKQYCHCLRQQFYTGYQVKITLIKNKTQTSCLHEQKKKKTNIYINIKTIIKDLIKIIFK